MRFFSFRRRKIGQVTKKIRHIDEFMNIPIFRTYSNVLVVGTTFRRMRPNGPMVAIK